MPSEEVPKIFGSARTNPGRTRETPKKTKTPSPQDVVSTLVNCWQCEDVPTSLPVPAPTAGPTPVPTPAPTPRPTNTPTTHSPSAAPTSAPTTATPSPTAAPSTAAPTVCSETVTTTKTLECDVDDCPQSFKFLTHAPDASFQFRTSAGCTITAATLSTSVRGDFAATPTQTLTSGNAADQALTNALATCGQSASQASCAADEQSCFDARDILTLIDQANLSDDDMTLFVLEFEQQVAISGSCPTAWAEAALEWSYTCPCAPSAAPTTAVPSAAPTAAPTKTPTAGPTAAPVPKPTATPSAAPSAAPGSPTNAPTCAHELSTHTKTTIGTCDASGCSNIFEMYDESEDLQNCPGAKLDRALLTVTVGTEAWASDVDVKLVPQTISDLFGNLPTCDSSLVAAGTTCVTDCLAAGGKCQVLNGGDQLDVTKYYEYLSNGKAGIQGCATDPSDPSQCPHLLVEASSDSYAGASTAGQAFSYSYAGASTAGQAFEVTVEVEFRVTCAYCAPPTVAPSLAPHQSPTNAHSVAPTAHPAPAPSASPLAKPTAHPTTPPAPAPTAYLNPTPKPSTSVPTQHACHVEAMSEPRGSQCDWDNCPMSFVWDYGLTTAFDKRPFDPTAGCVLTYRRPRRNLPSRTTSLHGLSTSRPRRRRDPASAEDPRRPVSTDYPRRGRGAAATPPPRKTSTD